MNLLRLATLPYVALCTACRGWNQKRQVLKAKKFLEDHQENSRTPDAPLINRKDAHLVFLYDCREWRSLRDILAGFYGRAFTAVDLEAYERRDTGRVVAFKSHNGSLPAWSMSQLNHPGAPLRGELWLVPSQTIFELDKFYGNGLFFQRVEIDCTHHRHKTYQSLTHDRMHVTSDVQRKLKAWIYLGIPEAWNVDAGYNWTPLRLRKSKNKEPHAFYYHSFRSDPLVHPT